MVQRSLVSRVNSDLHALKLKASNESPVVQGILDSLLSLTEFDPSANAVPETSSTFGAKKDAAPAVAEHEHVADVYGNCSVCHVCLHQTLTEAGTCKNCGET